MAPTEATVMVAATPVAPAATAAATATTATAATAATAATTATTVAASSAPIELAAAEACLLGQLGFLAIERRRHAAAEAIFTALIALRPARSYPYFGLATSRLQQGRFDAAAEVLRVVRLADPEEQAELDALLGLALRLAGRRGASRQVLEAVVRAAAPGAGVPFARSLLGLAPAGAAEAPIRSVPRPVAAQEQTA